MSEADGVQRALQPNTEFWNSAMTTWNTRQSQVFKPA